MTRSGPCSLPFHAPRWINLIGYHILLRTFQGYLEGIEGQARDLVATNAAEYDQGWADGIRKHAAPPRAMRGNDRSYPMHTLGKPLVLWATLPPPMILPTTADRIDQTVAILNIRLDQDVDVAGVPVHYDTVLSCGLFAVGVGLSFRACRQITSIPAGSP